MAILDRSRPASLGFLYPFDDGRPMVGCKPARLPPPNYDKLMYNGLTLMLHYLFTSPLLHIFHASFPSKV